jgi:hypothetical protein
MDSKLTPVPAGPHHDSDIVLVAPKDWTYVEDAPNASSNERRAAGGSDFSAGPRMTEPSLDPTLRPDVNNGPLATDRPSPGRRTSRSLARFLVAVCIGVAATLAWQSYSGTAKQMIANSAPRLGRLLLSPPRANQPSGRETTIEQPSPSAVQTSAPQAPSAQAGAVASSETAKSTTRSAPSRELQQQLETMEQDLAAVRQSVEQLAAGQEQMARDIAKLHTAGQDIRRRTSALPPAATTAHKPAPPSQAAPQSSTAPLTYPPPQPALQPSAAPLTYPPPEPAPQSTAAPLRAAPPEPPRPPMPVR